MTQVLDCDMKINAVHQLYQFDQVQSSDYALLGKKAFYLSQLQQQDILTTPGLVISSQVLKEFLATINWEKTLGFELVNSSVNLDIDNYQQLQQVSQTIKQEIIETDLPLNTICLLKSILEKWSNTSLLFRPSLYIENETSEDINIPNKLLKSHISTLSLPYLINTLKQTWLELFRAHSLFYFIKTGINLQQINLAVLIQPMYPCITSGKLEYNENIAKIEAIWGLPNALSEGQVIPDKYQVNLSTKNVEIKKLGDKTIAYRLINPYIGVENNLIHTNNNFLQAYMLSVDQQQQYALEEYYINQLIEITKKLQFNLNKNFNFEWVVCLDTDSSEPELYITQINLENSRKKLPNYAENYATEKTLYTDNTVNELNFMIKALGAAPGKVVNQAAILLDYRKQYQTIPPHKVLIVKSITPDLLPLMKNAAAVISEQGGMTCHAAIIARELGIPAIVGAKNATKLIKNGETVLVDGDQGKIYIVNGNIKLNLNQEISKNNQRINQEKTPLGTKLFVSLSQPSSIAKSANLPIDGVGLLRAELMMLEILQGQSPHVWIDTQREQELIDIWAKHIQEFAMAFAPKPVFYRAVDWRSHEFSGLLGGNEHDLMPEPNPMLGLRGTFKVTKDPTLFDIELAAIAKVHKAGYTNVNLILPFVRTVEEFAFCRRRIDGIIDKSAWQFQVWIMAEVPSVLFLLPEYVKAGVQGISIGTNDLTQLILGVDREQIELANVFNENHPAVKRAIIQLITTAKNLGIPCTICGQATTRYPELIEEFILNGITGISAELNAIDQTYDAIASAEKKILLNLALAKVK